MRLQKPAALLSLARELAASAEGLTLDEMAESVGCSRRTAERMRDAVEAAFAPLDVSEDGRKRRFRLTQRGFGQFASAPTAEELAELENAARALDPREPTRARLLRSLGLKVGAALREADRRRLAVDVEAQLAAETFACRVGPRPLADPEALRGLRQALLAGRAVKFDYGDPPRWRKAVPYGLLFGPRAYLVARTKNGAKPVLFRLDQIFGLEVLDEPGARPKDFDLKAFSEGSFGVYQEEPVDVVLRFSPFAARDARAYLFHPSQRMTDDADGSVIVRFHAGAQLEIAHHLMTWGDAVTIVEPESLKEVMRDEIEKLHAHHLALQPETGSKRRRSTWNSTRSSS
jgi:predicted DNA-binding transcriptional regulator YafY